MPNATELRLPSPAGDAADFSQGSIFFVGTATVILRYAGFTILTDRVKYRSHGETYNFNVPSSRTARA